MNLRQSILAVAFAAVASLGFGRLAHANSEEHEGEELNVHNQTGHEVVAFLFQDDHPHLDEGGGTQFAHLKSGESAVAHVPNCHFGILLVDADDIWHAEFHDCHSTDLTFKTDTGHGKKGHH
jgi:hypothetical protein